MIKRLSVDFDCTLNNIEVSTFIKSFIIDNIAPVSIVTNRESDLNNVGINDDVFELANNLGISDIHFLGNSLKLSFFIDRPDFLVHIDDMPYIVELINSHINCSTTSVLWHRTPNWQKVIMDHFI